MPKFNLSYSKQLLSACLGNFFEHYDTALFSFLSVFLAPLIFPEEESLTALILTYAMIPLGMLARPLGALVFGYIGDSYGRKQALVLSLGGMAIVTVCIALSPTYAQASFIAPLIFCIGRLLQNFLSAGETMGGAIYLLENTSEKHHDVLSGLYSATTIGGMLFASLGVALLSYYERIETGWRFLYLVGSLTAFCALVLRKQLPVKAWDNASVRTHQSLSDLLKILWTHRVALVLIATSAGFAYANYIMALVLLNGFVPLITAISKAEMMSLNTSLLVLDFCTLPFFGWLSSKISREKVMLGASLAVVLGGVPLFLWLPEASFMGIIAIRICLVLFGVAFFAPFHAWAQQLVPPAHRYIVISFAYALGSQVFGGPTAALSLWIFKSTQIVSSAAWYWVVLAVSSSIAVAISLVKKTEIIKRAA